MNDGTIYDTATELTWLQDAAFGGKRTWFDATTWAAGLSFAGFDDWRLPATDSTCSNGPNCTGSEFENLDYVALGNPIGGSFTNAGAFINLQATPSNEYWFATVSAADSNNAWFFYFGDGGGQSTDQKAYGGLYAWPVRYGHRAVPAPASLPLFATGLGLMALLAWRRSRLRLTLRDISGGT